MRSKVTMQTIADNLKVSKTVVSRVLSNKPGVSEETRQKVWLTANKLGYQINSSIMHVPSSRTGMIALLIPRGDTGRDLQYWGKVITKIEEELNRKSLSLILSGIDTSIPTTEGIPSCILDRKVDGILILGRIPISYIFEVNRFGVPVILVDSAKNYRIKADHVLADNFEGGYNATRYLLDCGHRKIGFLGDINFAFSFNERYKGFIEAISDFKMEMQDTQVESFSYTAKCEDEHFPLCISQIEDALKSNQYPSAMLCANDQNAYVLYEELSQYGLACPGDMSVIGFDNLEKSMWVTPRLTSIDACKDAIGMRAVQLLLRRMELPETRWEHVLISTEIVERESVRRIKD